MKKPIVLSVIAFIGLVAAFSCRPTHAQAPSSDGKPTFYHLVPGTYVNPWPRFTVDYPKDWVQKRSPPDTVFWAQSADPAHSENFMVNVGDDPRPLDQEAGFLLSFFKHIAQDVTLVSDKPAQLRDGTPAREIEIRMIINTVPVSQMTLAAKKGVMGVGVHVSWLGGKTGEHLEPILYSLRFDPGFDEPVKLPPDVQQFFDRWMDDFMSHDLAKVMTHVSDRFLHSGWRKGELEQRWRIFIGALTSLTKLVITDFIPAGDKAYYAGYTKSNLGTITLQEISIIKEDGEWRFYGDQRDLPPVD